MSSACASRNKALYRRIAGLLSLTLFLCAIAARATFSAEVQLSAAIDPPSFSSDQTAHLTITVNGRHTAEINLPVVNGLHFHRQGVNRMFHLLDRAVTASSSYTYQVKGDRPGTYTIPPITVTVDGTFLRTQALTCTIIPTTLATSPEIATAGQLPPLFIRLLPQKRRAIVNEVVPTTIKAYVKDGIKANFTSLPALKNHGVVLDIISRIPRQHQETIDNTPFTVLAWEGVLTGVKTGRHELAVEMAATLHFLPSPPQSAQPQADARTPDISTSTATSFDQYRKEKQRVISSSVPYSILPLPDRDRPEDFSGAVGTFSLEVQAQPTTVVPGDPVDLTMTVAGSGNFATVSAPILLDRNGIKTSPPAQRFYPDRSPYHGRMLFEQTVIVNTPSLRQIGPVSFSFFDTASHRYQTLQTDPIELTMRDSASSPSAAEPVANTPQTFPKTDPLVALAPPKLTATTSVRAYAPLFSQPTFIAFFALFVLAILGISAFRMFRLIKRRIIPDFRWKQAIISHGKKARVQLARSLKQPEEEGSLETARTIVRGYLAVCWRTNPATLTTADVAKRSGKNSPVHRLFVLADRQSYGAAPIDDREKQSLYESIAWFIGTYP